MGMSFKSILSYYLGGKRLGLSLLILLFLVSKSFGQTAGFISTFIVLSL